MRELKFRFWNKIGRFYVYGDYAGVTSSGKYIYYDYDAHVWEDPLPFDQTIIEPEQFTGLTDKNGKEIYEGDVLIYRLIDDYIKQIETLTVKFEKGKFCVGKFCKDLSSYYGPYLEIIGNVHE